MKLVTIAKSIAVTLAAFVTSHAAHAEDLVAECAPFTVVGSGPDLILVPGLGSSPDVWDATVERLSQDYRIHLVHVAGFAGRPADGDPDSLLDRTAAEIIGQLDCKGVERAAYAGHSLGGFLGLKLAIEHPNRIERLVVVDSLPFYPLIFSPMATVEGVTPQADGIRAQLLGQDDAGFEASQRAGVRSLVKSVIFHDTVVGWSLTSDRATFAGAFHTLMTTDLRSQLGRVKAETTIIAAANAFAPRSRVEPLFTNAYGGLEGAKIRVIEDSYHFVMFDQPEAFMIELLNGLSPDPDADDQAL